MATTAELQQKLLAKLRELFQLDQPDLDFGFYRVMHAKAKEINDYLDNKLPAVISAAFKDSDGAKLQQDFDAAKQAVMATLGAAAIKPDGSLDALYAATPLGQQYAAAKTVLETGTAQANGEADVYDHLYHFFERYYDKGDFVSLRYLTRETDRKAKPYAIPYAGEEVMLHWANADQYYIKTSENFSHYSFDLTKFAEFVKMDVMARTANQIPDTPMKVHFEVVEADEGEHGNVKAGKDRFFILHDGTPCALDADGLHVYFEHREDPNMTGQAGKWQEKLRTDAFETLKADVPKLDAALAEMIAGLPPENAASAKDYARLLFMEFERTKDGKKEKFTPLSVYLKRYMARNTSDYFIHKDLSGFLRRELDFYIKNDLMVLDNVAAPNTTAESVAKWLDTLKVFRRIADDIITFLAQLEDFQKKLWLKKKFVVQCDYCLTMDRVPEELRADVLANPQQLEAWKKLGTDVDPKTVDMTAIDARMVDTQYFNEAFKQKLLNKIKGDFDEQCDGVLVHGDNLAALNLFGGKYDAQIKCFYIDPPYNTGKDEFKYKDGYGHSSWLSMMKDRLVCARRLLANDGVLTCSIADQEVDRLRIIGRSVFGSKNFLANFVWNNEGNIDNQSKVKVNHEYMLAYCKEESSYPHAQVIAPDVGKNSKLYRETIENSITKNGPANPVSEVVLPKGFPASIEEGRIAARNDEWPHLADDVVIKDSKLDSPVRASSGWSSRELLDEFIAAGCKPIKDAKGLKTWFKVINTGAIYCYKERANSSHVLSVIKNVGTVKKTATMLESMSLKFKYPKPVDLVKYVMRFVNDKKCVVCDFFAGSGTTAHAAIQLRREYPEICRQYILVEMGDHFDTVLMPRVQKVVYSPDWKDGKPTAAGKGISHCFKYLRLESYEDALNNLQVDGTKGAAFAGVGDYFLKYMLDVETKGSPSLLNVESFANPFGYKLIVKKPGSEEREERTVDLVETFNYLIGLRVKNTAAMRRYTADFERLKDEELPEDGHTKLVLKGGLKFQDDGAWAFRLVEGWCPKNRATPNDGAKERVLVVWRTLTGDTEKDNAVLNAFLQHEDINALDGEYDVIYVNGSNNVPNLRKDSDTWKVRLIEEDFRARMWEGL